MGILLMTFGSTKRRLLLSSSNLVGRHWRCDTSVFDKRVPLYWVEVRWFDTHWGWRPLSSLSRQEDRVHDGKWLEKMEQG